MKAKIITQYSGEGALYTEINSLLSKDYKRFRILVAYVSVDGLRLIRDEFESFLKNGSSAEIIIGFTAGKTSKDIVNELFKLQKDFPDNLDVRIFTPGNDQDIFHPKIYWFTNEKKHIVILGSNNFTKGGLLANFEVSILMDLESGDKTDKQLITQIEEMWKRFATPDPPLTKENILEINENILETINNSQAIEQELKKIEKIRKISHPFSKIDKHKAIRANIEKLHKQKMSYKKLSKPRQTEQIETASTLIMEVLTETRNTQVQFPVDVLEPFFEIYNLSQKNEIIISEIKDGKKLFTKKRPVISQANKTYRIEIPGIKGLHRPVILIVSKKNGKNGGRHFDYKIIPQQDENYAKFRTLLDIKGQQRRPTSRKWILK